MFFTEKVSERMVVCRYYHSFLGNCLKISPGPFLFKNLVCLSDIKKTQLKFFKETTLMLYPHLCVVKKNMNTSVKDEESTVSCKTVFMLRAVNTVGRALNA